MFPHLGLQDTVGDRNARWDIHFLSEHNIELVDHSLGGAHSRTIAWTVGLEQPELVLTPVDMEQ